MVAINKMDTVEWSQDRYKDIVKKLGQFLKQAGFKDLLTFDMGGTSTDVALIQNGIAQQRPPPIPCAIAFRV